MEKKKFRIIFMGTPDFAVPSLKALLAHGEDIAAVITQPDRPKGRGRKLAAPPVKDVALGAGLPVLQPVKIKTDAFLDALRDLHPDLVVVAAYGKILPKALLDLPPLGAINVHGSLLPKYRGAAPIQRALVNGETETGITIMQMDEGMDTGDILLSGALPIAPQDTAATLAGKMADLGADLLIKALDLLRDNRLRPVKQDESLASSAPPLCKHEGRINWTDSARAIGCRLRGFDPWPAASTTLEGTNMRFFKPEVIDRPAQEKPGTLCRADAGGLLIATGKGYLLVKEIQREGGKRMPVESFLRGRPLQPGLQCT